MKGTTISVLNISIDCHERIYVKALEMVFQEDSRKEEHMTFSSELTRATKPTRTVPRIQMIVLLLFCLIQGVINQKITDESKICNRHAFARY